MSVTQFAGRGLHGEVAVAELGVKANNVMALEQLESVEALSDADAIIVAGNGKKSMGRITYQKVKEQLNEILDVAGGDRDALNTLQSHAWRRWQVGDPQLGPLHLAQITYDSDKSDCYRTVYYASEITVDTEAKTVSLVDPQTVTAGYTYTSGLITLRGKYWSFSSAEPLPYVYYSPEDAEYKTGHESDIYDNGGYYARMYAQLLSPVQSRIGEGEIILSGARETYPDIGILDGYEYEYLGVPLDNAQQSLKCAMGTYIGTGAFGKDAPNELVFDFEPKLVIINGTTNFVRGQTSGDTVIRYYMGGFYTAEWEGQSLRWYASNYAWDNSNTSVALNKPNLYAYKSRVQLNEAGVEYHYIAFG